jgi:hypothetical protein
MFLKRQKQKTLYIDVKNEKLEKSHIFAYNFVRLQLQLQLQRLQLSYA